MRQSTRIIDDAQKWLTDEKFDQLMEEFVPEAKLRIGLLGGHSWGESWSNSYTRDGVYQVLIQRLYESLKGSSQP